MPEKILISISDPWDLYSDAEEENGHTRFAGRLLRVVSPLRFEVALTPTVRLLRREWPFATIYRRLATRPVLPLTTVSAPANIIFSIKLPVEPAGSKHDVVAAIGSVRLG